MDAARGQPPSPRWLTGASLCLAAAAFIVSVLAAACSQSATEITEPESGEEQSAAAMDESRPATTSTVLGQAPAATTTSAVPRLSVIMEQHVGGSLREPVRADDGSIVPLGEDSHMNAVVVGPAGLVAVGEARSRDNGNVDAAVWISSEGREWSRIDDEPGELGDATSVFGAESEQTMVEVIAGSWGLIAVGVDGVADDRDAAVWVSDNGSAWERVTHDPAVFGGAGDQLINAVTEMNGQLVAVGEAGERAAVWTSGNRDTWTVADVAGTESGPSVMNDVAAFSGGLIAVGSAGANMCPAVWLSADGLTWQPVSAEMAGRDSLFAADECAMSPMFDVAVVSRGVVAVGTRFLSDEDPSYADFTTDGPLVWRSVDGYEWVLEDPEFVAEGVDSRYGYLRNNAPIALEQVLSDGERLFAVGSYELLPSANDLPGFASLWYSDDGGVNWALAGEAALPPASGLLGARGLAQFESGLVVVGADAAPAGRHPDYGWMTWSSTPAVWLAPLGE